MFKQGSFGALIIAGLFVIGCGENKVGVSTPETQSYDWVSEKFVTASSKHGVEIISDGEGNTHSVGVAAALPYSADILSAVHADDTMSGIPDGLFRMHVSQGQIQSRDRIAADKNYAFFQVSETQDGIVNALEKFPEISGYRIRSAGLAPITFHQRTLIKTKRDGEQIDELTWWKLWFPAYQKEGVFMPILLGCVRRLANDKTVEVDEATVPSESCRQSLGKYFELYYYVQKK